MTAAPNTVPIVSVIGKGDSGKTTFLEKLIAELADRGVRVATVKHHIHDYDIDVPGKDSYRHARAGAVATMVSSPEKFALIHDVESEMPLDTIARIAHDAGCDLLITEGYKHEGRNRIEISRRERSDTLICTPAEMTALVTDNKTLAERVSAEGVPTFDLDEGHKGVADLIVKSFLDSDALGGVSGGGTTRSSAAAKRRGLSEHGASAGRSAGGTRIVATDSHGRRIDYLRISLTDRCNLRCVYCMPETGVTWKDPSEILSYDEILRFARIAVEEGIGKIRLTGGEPLVRRGVSEFVRELRAIEGVESLALTTNATLLPRFAAELRDAGLERINVSLDSLDPAEFAAITRGGKLEDALAGLDAAFEAGFSPGETQRGRCPLARTRTCSASRGCLSAVRFTCASSSTCRWATPRKARAAIRTAAPPGPRRTRFPARKSSSGSLLRVSRQGWASCFRSRRTTRPADGARLGTTGSRAPRVPSA